MANSPDNSGGTVGGSGGEANAGRLPTNPAAPPPLKWRKYAKVSAWLFVLFVAALFLLRNSQSVSVGLVFSDVEMPLFVALFIAMLLGFILGSGLVWMRARGRAKTAARKADKK